MPTTLKFTLASEHEGQRLDMVLARLLPQLGKRGAKRLIGTGSVTLNGKIASAITRVKNGDIVVVSETARDVETTARLLKADLPYLFIFKPIRMHCAQIAGCGSQNLEQILPGLLAQNGLAGEARLLQRLDYDTSGIVLAANDDCGKEEFLRAQDEGRCLKLYLALLSGILPAQITVKNCLDTDKRKKSKVLEKADVPLRHTVFTPIHFWRDFAELSRQWPGISDHLSKNDELGYTLAGCAISKGARHQIRAHAAHIGFPLAGDGLYNEEARDKDNFFLHQTRLAFGAHECLFLPGWLPEAVKTEALKWLED